MRKIPALLCGGLLLAQAILTLSSQSGCGGDNLQFLGNGNSASSNDNVSISGNLESPPSAEQLAVFVFINLADPDGFTNFRDLKNSLVNLNTLAFSISNLSAGNASVYVADDANKDSRLDPSENFALLADDDRCLRGLKDGDVVRIDGISADFLSREAEAKGITKNGVACSGSPSTPTPAPSSTPSIPTSSPSPSPTPSGSASP